MANRIELPIKAMALDFDGVITNLDVDWNAVIRRASQIVGQDIKSLITFYENNHGTPIFQKVSVEMEKIELQAIKTAQPKPHIEDFLQKLKEKQVPVYIVSMQSLKPIKTFLDQHCLASYFNGIITEKTAPANQHNWNTFQNKQELAPAKSCLLMMPNETSKNVRNLAPLAFSLKENRRQKKPRNPGTKFSTLRTQT